MGYEGKESTYPLLQKWYQAECPPCDGGVEQKEGAGYYNQVGEQKIAGESAEIIEHQGGCAQLGGYRYGEQLPIAVYAKEAMKSYDGHYRCKGELTGHIPQGKRLNQQQHTGRYGYNIEGEMIRALSHSTVRMVFLLPHS